MIHVYLCLYSMNPFFLLFSPKLSPGSLFQRESPFEIVLQRSTLQTVFKLLTPGYHLGLPITEV